MADCYEPSSLINWVHEKVPFLDIGFNNTGQGAEDLIDNLSEGVDHYYDYLLRAVVWGATVTVAWISLLVLTCVWYCCTGCFCRRSKGDCAGYRVAKTVCGALLILLVLIAISVIGVCLWAEGQFSEGFSGNIARVQSLISNVSSISTEISGNDTSSGDTLHFLTEFDTSSHWIFVSYFSFLFLPLIGVLLAIVATTLCKHPLTMILMLVVLMVMTFFLILTIGIAVAFLILYSDVCVGLQYKQLHDETRECILELTDYTNTLDNLCNDAYRAGVNMLVATAALVIVYICMQFLGSCYAGLYAGYRGRARIHPHDNTDEENHELQSKASSQSNIQTQNVTTEDDNAVLLSSVEMEPQSPITEDVQQYLSNQSPNPTPSAPPKTTVTSISPSTPSTSQPSTMSPPTYPPLPLDKPLEHSQIITFGKDTATV